MNSQPCLSPNITFSVEPARPSIEEAVPAQHTQAQAANAVEIEFPTAGPQNKGISFSVPRALVLDSDEREYRKRHTSRELGVGNTGAVFRCATSDGRTLAMKASPIEAGKLSATIATRPSAEVKRKKPVLMVSPASELDVMNALRGCPNVAQLDSVATSPTTFYTFMEEAKGNPLDEWVKNPNYASQKKRKTVATNLLRAVASVHDHDVGHMDIKPENFSVNRALNIKVLDFGFGRRSQGDEPTSGPDCGTKYFAAPEVYTRNYNPKRADCFSLGLILFGIMEGRWPFNQRDRDGNALYAYVSLKNAVPVKFTKTPEAWRPVILDLLKLNPEERISANEALGRIARAQEQETDSEGTAGCKACAIQ